MSIDIEDIPTIESAIRVGRRSAAASELAEAYPLHPEGSGNILESLGVPLSLKLMNSFRQTAFPSVAEVSKLQASIAAASYTTYGTDCGGYNYNATCNEACFGFAPEHMDPFYCATCAEQAADPDNNPSYNWHFVGSRGSIQYKDREPDVCNGKDAWKWKIQGACGNCQHSSVYRCHDGYKKYPDRNYWDSTICQGLVSCDDQLTPC